MSSRARLVIEIGCEEIPSRMLAEAGHDLTRIVVGLLDRAGLAHGEAATFFTPRRLAVAVADVATATPEREEVLMGPPAAAAWDAQGQPTKAALGFAAKQGAGPGALERVSTPKGDYAAVRVKRGGEPAGSVLAEPFAAAVARMTFPKTMRWGERGERFVRPVHWLTALLGPQVLPFELFGIKAGRGTAGHRVLGSGVHTVNDAQSWERDLENAGVIVDPLFRRERLHRALSTAAQEAGGILVEDQELLDECAGIVEFPGAVAGRFDERFVRDLPAEVLVTCLRHHQKAFCVSGPAGTLLPAFVVAANRPDDPEGHVQRGNEWVVVGRLEDAVFFWQEDRKRRLEERRGALEGVVFQQDLGTFAAKTLRVIDLVQKIATTSGFPAASLPPLIRAAELARCDLVTGLVGEFPELQGVAGGLLAREDGESEEAVMAVTDLYRPSGAEDALPQTQAGRILGLADRLDTLAGCFAVGLAPSGSKDPFALRRAGSGVIRLALEEPEVDLALACRSALIGFNGSDRGTDLSQKTPEILPLLNDFLFERFAALMEREGARYDELAAVRGLGVDQFFPADLARRLEALAGFRESDDFLIVALAAKRVRNILAQAAERGEIVPAGEGEARLVRPEEKSLLEATSALEGDLRNLLKDGNYRAALARLAGLRNSLTLFFDKILVMDPDENLRRARLGLLVRIHTLAHSAADLSELVVEGKENKI